MWHWLHSARARRAARDDLTVCPHCGTDFVAPVRWAKQEDANWWIRLRCGECGEAREVVVPQDVADRFDRALDRACDEIAATLRRLERERMTDEVEALATALRLDLLDATDFDASR